MIQLKLDESTAVHLIPVRSDDPYTETGVAEKIAKKADDMAEDLAKTIDVIRSQIMKKLEHINAPSELELKFNFGLSAKGNVVIGEFEGSSSFEVTIKWNAKAEGND